MWERNINWLPLICSLTGDWTRNLGMYPDWEWNPLRFGLLDDSPTNWATLARADSPFLNERRESVSQHLLI